MNLFLILPPALATVKSPKAVLYPQIKNFVQKTQNKTHQLKLVD